MLDNIKSNFIMTKIFNFLQKIRKLNMIKYNERMIHRLNIDKEDIIGYGKLKEFNKIYHINIEDIKIKDLTIIQKYLGNKALENLCEIGFKKLIILNLSYADLSDINALEKLNSKELEVLELRWNRISDINVLERVNFKKLKILNLSNNNISDINVLEKVNFNELLKLILFFNNITDIKVLTKVNFKKLKDLDLSYNPISNINILKKLNFKELNK